MIRTSVRKELNLETASKRLQMRSQDPRNYSHLLTVNCVAKFSVLDACLCPGFASGLEDNGLNHNKPFPQDCLDGAVTKEGKIMNYLYNSQKSKGLERPWPELFLSEG